MRRHSGPLGTPNEVAFGNGVNRMPVATQMKWYDVWGTEPTCNHRSPGPIITTGRTEFVYTHPMVELPQRASPFILDSSHTITAEIEVPKGGAAGMILASGGRSAGHGFYLLKGKPPFP